MYLTVTRPEITFAISFVSTKDYSLADRDEDFEVSKKTPERELLYSDHGHTRLAGFSNADWQDTLLIESRPHDIVSFLKEIFCHKK